MWWDPVTELHERMGRTGLDLPWYEFARLADGSWRCTVHTDVGVVAAAGASKKAAQRAVAARVLGLTATF